jgi:2-phosphoglycolate phosphatase
MSSSLLQWAEDFRAVLFDFDGTLGDSYSAITASVNHVRARHGLPPMSEEEVRPHVGRGAGNLLQQVVPGSSTPADDVAAYRAHHPSVLHGGTRLMPGAVEALRTLHQCGFFLGVCSNKPIVFTRDLIAFLGIDPYLNVVLGPEDVPRPKPDPDMLCEAMARLKVTPKETLYIGDMVVDIQTARAANVSVWVVPTGSEEIETLRLAKPDRLLRNLYELVGDGANRSS